MLRLAGGILLLMVATFMLIGVLAGGGHGHSFGINVFVFLLTVVFPGTTGLMLLRQHLRQLPASAAAPALAAPAPAVAPDHEILRLAERKSGRLTVVEVVAETTLPTVEAAEAAMTSLVERGLAEPQVTDSGLIVYAFPDIQRLKDKGTGRDVLDQ